MKDIAKRIRRTKATILLATDTFISQYARASDEGDLASLRLAVCGAERVRDETRQLLRRRCNMEILEGYGVTEAAPVVAANQPGANRSGSVGKLMAGMEWKLSPTATASTSRPCSAGRCSPTSPRCRATTSRRGRTAARRWGRTPRRRLPGHRGSRRRG